MKRDYLSPEMEIVKFSLKTSILTGSVPTNTAEDNVEGGGEKPLPTGGFNPFPGL